MPQKKMFPIPWPIKGYAETVAYSAVPDGFTLDAQNVRPFDSLGKRLRGGQRAGLAKYFDSQVNGSNAIQSLIQGTTAVDPDTGSPTTHISEDFSTYSTGQLDVVESSKWKGFQDGGSFSTEDDGSNHLEVVASGTVSENSGGASSTGLAMSATYIDTASYSLTEEYDITLKAVLTGASGIGWNGSEVWVYFRMDESTPSDQENYYARVSWEGSGTSGFEVLLFEQSTVGQLFRATGVTIPLADSNTTEEFTLKVEVRSNSITAYIDGTQVGTASGSDTQLHTDDTGFGIAVNDRSESSGSHANGITFLSVVEAEEPVATARSTYLATVAGGSVYLSDSPPTTLTQATSGNGALENTLFMGATEGPASPNDSASFNTHRFIYYCDGTNYKRLDLEDNTVRSWAAASGSLPADSDGNKARIIALYRNRIVLSGVENDPQNWFMSAVGDPTDWNYSPATVTATQAVAGNVSDAGKLGDRVTALIPFSDDLLLIGGDHTIWQMSGDPAAGGRFDNISYDTGILGDRAWAVSPNNVLYFLGSNGLYRMVPGSAPELISQQALDESITGLDYSSVRPILVWDRDRQGLHVFLSPVSEPGSAVTHFWYDARTESFWPEKYPTVAGPTAATVFDGDAPADRATIFGGYDGYIRLLDNSEKNDDAGASTEAIDSYCDIGPTQLGNTMLNTVIHDIQILLGSGSDGADLDVFAGSSPERVVNDATPRYSTTLNAGRNKSVRQRARGNALLLRLRNATAGESWSYEQGSAVARVGGKMRGRTTDNG